MKGKMSSRKLRPPLPQLGTVSPPTDWQRFTFATNKPANDSQPCYTEPRVKGRIRHLHCSRKCGARLFAMYFFHCVKAQSWSPSFRKRLSPNYTWFVSHVTSRHDTFVVSSPGISAASSLSNSTARHARHDELDWVGTSNVSCRVET